jgi:selenocysteine lyase/cysteine desulfurase
MKLIVFIHTCKAYEETRAKLLEQTWANNTDTVFITDNATSKLNNHIYIGDYLKGHTYHPENVKKMF